MSRSVLKWTLLGCVVIYILLTIDGLFDDRTRPVRVVLWAFIIGATMWLVFLAVPSRPVPPMSGLVQRGTRVLSDWTRSNDAV